MTWRTFADAIHSAQFTRDVPWKIIDALFKVRINSRCKKIVTNDAEKMRITLWKKNSSNYTASFANAMIADL